MAEDEMVGWPHQVNGHEFEQTLGDSEGQGSLAWGSSCTVSWGYSLVTVYGFLTAVASLAWVLGVTEIF